MKKQYINPTLKTMVFETRQWLMTGSQNVSLKGEMNSGFQQYGRDDDDSFWDE
ncbi:MAG: hypothetical protein IJ533_06505 [Prevotella sp.]|nr:hypothetical protein [Prevotella sp.]